MWVKSLGAVCILVASVLWGNMQINKLRARVRQLEEFRLALRLLAAEVGYTATPLPRALEQVSSRMEIAGVRAFFENVALQLRHSKIADATAAWLSAAQETRQLLYLTANDWTVLARAAAGLGGLGREDQLKQLAAAEVQLATHVADATALAAGGEKMWRYLGVLSGMAIVILLL